MNKKLKIVLIGSLVLNIFLGGVIVGQFCHVKPKRMGAGVVKEFVETHKKEQSQMDLERAVLMDLIKAKEFDQAAFDAQLEKISVMQGTMYKQFMTKMAQKLRAMPADQRDRMIEKMTNRKAMRSGMRPQDRSSRFDQRGHHSQARLEARHFDHSVPGEKRLERTRGDHQRNVKGHRSNGHYPQRAHKNSETISAEPVKQQE